MVDDTSRRRFLLGSTVALTGLAGCTSVSNPLDSEKHSGNEDEVEDTTTTTVPDTTQKTTALDGDLAEDLKKVNQALEQGSFSSWNGRVLEGDGDGNLEAQIRLPDVTSSGGVKTRYADDAGAVDALLTNASYQLGNAFELAGEELADDDFSSFSLAVVDHMGFGYGVKMEDEKARDLWNNDGTLSDTLTSPGDRANRVKITQDDVPPAVYLTEGSKGSLSFGDESLEVYGLDIDENNNQVDVVIDDSQPQTLNFGEPHRKNGRRLVASYNPLKQHSKENGVAILSKGLNCDDWRENLYTGDIANFTSTDQDYAVELNGVKDNETAEVVHHLPEDTAEGNVTAGESYQFDRNMSYTVEDVIPTNTTAEEGVAVLSVERC